MKQDKHQHEQKISYINHLTLAIAIIALLVGIVSTYIAVQKTTNDESQASESCEPGEYGFCTGEKSGVRCTGGRLRSFRCSGDKTCTEPVKGGNPYCAGVRG